MTASDHLSGRQFLYHYSSPENRASIEADGLKPHNPFDEAVHYSPEDAPKGVYMTDTWKVAKMVGQHHGMDVWRVRAKALDEVHPDPDDQGDYGAHSVYTPRKIPPDRISRVQGLGNGS